MYGTPNGWLSPTIVVIRYFQGKNNCAFGITQVRTPKTPPTAVCFFPNVAENGTGWVSLGPGLDH